MDYYITKSIKGEFREIRARVVESLQRVGFGVVSELQMDEKFKEKLGVEFKPYTILGVCNPKFAHQAIQKEDKLGVLLPCNVVVIDQPDGNVEVAVIDARTMIGNMGNGNLREIAEEVSRDLEKALMEV